ncbi:MAG TPA: T9SS type A sorting domain-containing protein, partial [Bacteroidales bacterium]|nr:T9SS type A sorting domain-containing protein [Bacteroidales bacterium]
YDPSNLTSTTHYRRLAKDGTCNTFTASAGVWIVTVRPQFTAGAIATTGETICYNTDPEAIGNVTAASGGDNAIAYKWQSSPDGNEWSDITDSNAATYDPSNLTSTTHYRRLAKDGTCNTFTASAGVWIVTVRPQFTAGAISNTGETICYNTDPEAIGNVTSASGGDNAIAYKWQSSPDGNEWSDITDSNAATYDPSNLTSTTHYRRLAKDGTCNTFTASAGVWIVTVRPQFTAGAIATTGETICYAGSPAQIGSTTAASGGDQTITYSWRSSADNYTAAITGANAATYTPPAGLTTTTTYRRYAEDGTCNTTPEQSAGEWTVTVEPTPVSGNFINSHTAFSTLCEATPVSAVLTGSSGGNGTDQTEYRVFYSTYYTNWMPYSGQVLSIPGALHIEIRSRRLATYCGNSEWTYSGWSFEMTPYAGTLTKDPDVSRVCEGTPVWADLSDAFGGNNTDEKQYRKQTGSGWGSWMPYDGSALSTAGSTGIEIRSRRLAGYCTSSAWITVGWDVESTPVAGILLPLPAQTLVCETTQVSAGLLPGTGGSGVDQTEYRTHNGTSWSSWMPYTPGSSIAASGLSHIEVRTSRQGDVCSSSTFSTISWDVEKQAQAGMLLKQPLSAMVCEGSVVSATLLPGQGGNGIDELHYRTRNGNMWSLWQPYTSAGSISTSGVSEVEIRTRRLSTQCLYSDEYVVTWLVEPAPQAFAGGNATICANSSYTLSGAQVSNASGVMWSSSGDGSFSNVNTLNPTYTPGAGDKLSGQVVLTLTANTNGICQVQSVMQLSITTPVTPSLSIAANEPTVCQGTPVQYTATVVYGGISPILTWKVNGQVSGSNTPVFIYVPQQGDIVTAELLSSHGCVTQSTALSNAVSVNVVPIALQLQAVPAQGGQATYSGTVMQGSVVTLTATANPGYSFSGWYTTQGQLVSTSPIWQLTLTACFTGYEARFSSNASLSGRLRYYNPIESQIPSTQFMAQLFKSGTAISAPQALNIHGEYHFQGLDPATDYTLRLWEQSSTNQLGGTWMWNNWGGITGLDALIVGNMIIEVPLSAYFPWIQPTSTSSFTGYSVAVGDVNNSGNLTANDALAILIRATNNTSMPVFPGNRHNFIVSGSRVTHPGMQLYPQAPELVFQSYGTYTATTPAHQVYHEVNPGVIGSGNNYLNIYLTASGDMNASYVPGAPLKTTAMLTYGEVIRAGVGEEISLPVYVDREVVLGAVTLGLRYNTSLLEVIDAEGFAIRSIDRAEGVIRAGWYEVGGAGYSAEMPLLTLKARLKQEIGSGVRYMELLPMTEFATPDARVIESLPLRTVAIQTGEGESIAGVSHQVMPNPFRERTVLSFTLPEAGMVSLDIYNQFGQKVHQLLEANLRAGYHSYELHRGDLGNSGTYIYRLHFNNGTKTIMSVAKIVLLR